MENEVNWSERRKGGFEWRTISQDFLCSICIFSPRPMLYLPPEKALDPLHFHLLWWLVWIKTFLVALFLRLTDCSSVHTVIKWLTAPPLWMTMWGRALTFPRSGLHGDLQTHLQVQYTTLPMTFIWVQVCNRYVFWLNPFGRLFSAERRGYSHSALSSGTITAHLIPNWSWHEDIRHGECSWTLTIVTAVDVSISALYLMCLVRVVTCTAKKETSPPTYTLTVLWMPIILDRCVFVRHP